MSKDDAGASRRRDDRSEGTGAGSVSGVVGAGIRALVPGAEAKAVLYFVCIMGLFGYGVYLSSSNEPCRDGTGTIGYGRAVYFSFRDGDWRLSYLGQVTDCPVCRPCFKPAG